MPELKQNPDGPASAPAATPEPLAAILAEMRAARNAAGDTTLVSSDWLNDWADRIEAAVERERDEDRQLAAIAESDEAFARCARCDRPERAPGNAAAMREALEQALVYCESDQKSGIAYSDNDVLVPMLRAALAAPARNVDRPECATRDGTYNTWYRETWKMSREDCPDWSVWLFDKAKGGAK